MKALTTRSSGAWKSAAAKRLLKLAGSVATVEEAVEKVVSNILLEVPTAPTDLEALKQRLKISDFVAEEMPFSGELRVDGAGFKVVYSSFLSRERQRFTIAHELGHAIFESTGSNRPRHGEELERLCDMIAAEILMPKQIFLQHANGKLSIKKVIDLARLFQTSISSTARRYADLRGVTVFQVADGEILWGIGEVRRGKLTSLYPTLGEAIGKVIAKGNYSDDFVRYPAKQWSGEWKLEGMPLGQNGRTIFLFRPFPPTIARLEPA